MNKKQQKEAKKAAEKAKTELFNQMRRDVSAALENPDLLSLIPMFKTFNKNGIEGTAEYYQKLSPEMLKWALELTDKNMHDYYERTWGWNENKKINELKDREARFIVLKTGETPIGFIHIRFEFEDNLSHVYIYELQIDPKYQRHGLGKFLLQAAELIAMKTGMYCTMLTVLKVNEPAMKFYLKNNYKLDPISPGRADPEYADEYFHEILYKDVKKRPQI